MTNAVRTVIRLFCLVASVFIISTAINAQQTTHPVIGGFTSVNASGLAVGSALDTVFPDNAPELRFTMTNLGSVFATGYANQGCVNTPQNGCWPGRGFSVQIPAQFCDGEMRTVWVYAVRNLVFGPDDPLSHISVKCYAAIDAAHMAPHTPILFIPGIAGSVLKERESNGGEPEIWPAAVQQFSGLERLDMSLGADIIATDAIRTIPTPFGDQDIYSDFLQKIGRNGQYLEYDVAGVPERRDVQCQSEEQRANKPTLFVFAYDWRKGAEYNADKLNDYMQCIERFYPQQKVDIVAHSMGGVVARRYLLDHSLNHNVRKMITVASPYLGAPRALEVLLKGNFIVKVGFYLHKNSIKQMALNARGLHQLLPSDWNWNFMKPALKYEIDDGTFSQEFPNAPELAQWLDNNLPATFDGSRRYEDSRQFHFYPSQGSQSGQDDWRNDLTGVEFHHLFGDLAGFPRRIEGTPHFVRITGLYDSSTTDIRQRYWISTSYGQGDGTVPTISSRRSDALLGLNLNAPNAHLYVFSSPNVSSNETFNHNGLMLNTSVQDLVKSLTASSPGRPGETGVKPEMSKKEWKTYLKQQNEQALKSRAAGVNDPENYFVDVTGVSRLDITDSQGNTNTDMGQADRAVPNVFYEYGSAPFENLVVPHQVAMPAGSTYDIKFTTTSDVTQINILKGTSEITASQTIKYLDMSIPAGKRAWLSFTPQGVQNLRYDADGNGTFETTVNPSYSVTGNDALDVTPPEVTISDSYAKIGTTFTITASDSESGVGNIYYQVKGQNPQPYTGPFLVPNVPSAFVTAYVDDHAGNRGTAFKYLDHRTPVTTAVASPTEPTHGWVSSPVNVDLNALDDIGGSGIKTITYSAARPSGATGGTTIAETVVTIPNSSFEFPHPATVKDGKTVPVNIENEGITILSYASADKSGNVEQTQTLQAKIDHTAPRTSSTIAVNENLATITLGPSDAKINFVNEQPVPDPNFPVSGVISTKYKIDNGEWKDYYDPFIFIGAGSGGTHTIYYYSVDRVGNTEFERSKNFTVTATVTPKSVIPVLQCVGVNGGNYFARFGYINYNSEPVTVSIGADNGFTPNAVDRGQPTVFQSGVNESIFEAAFTEKNITWTLKGPDNLSTSVTARRTTLSCQ